MYISEFEKVSPCLLRLSIFFSGNSTSHSSHLHGHPAH